MTPTTLSMRLQGSRTLVVALALALGFAAGVLLVAVLGGAKGGVTTTRTIAQQVTVTRSAKATPAAPAAAAPTAGKAFVPSLVDQTLDVAKDRASSVGFDVAVDAGGGLLGVVVDDNWVVVDQSPRAGSLLAPGETVHVDVQRA